MPRRSARAVAACVFACGTMSAVWAGEGSGGDQLLDFGGAGRSKEPITITAERLEYDYKANVVVYRGAVEAVQGAAKLRADTVTVRLASGATTRPASGATSDGGAAPIATANKVQEIVAVGNVRIDQGTRWATGGRAVFDQARRTFVLTESPIMHDEANEVAGDRVTVFLDENRSVVEGGDNKRVKAVLHPKQGPGDGAGADRVARP